MAVRSVHILDPQLIGAGGHYLTHDGQLVRELKRRGIPTALYGRKGCTVVCEGLVPLAVFSSDIFKETATDPLVWPIGNFHTVNQEFLNDLMRIDTTYFSADDLLYFPNLLQNQLYGIALWLASIPADRRPKVAVMFRFLNHAMEYLHGRANKELIPLYYRYAAQILSEVQPRSFLCADTRELATVYQQMTGKPVLELPNPMDVSEVAGGAAHRSSDGRPVIIYQGHTSPLRGFHFLPEIIDRCAAFHPRPRFVIQVQDRNPAASLQLDVVLAQLAKHGPEDVELLHGVLSAADYVGMLQRADIVLLPYSPKFYGVGSSGVFTESASLGKVIVVPAGTMPARQGAEYGLGVVPAATWTPEGMATAVATAIEQLPALRAQAATSAPRFRAENCARAFWDQLLAATG